MSVRSKTTVPCEAVNMRTRQRHCLRELMPTGYWKMKSESFKFWLLKSKKIDLTDELKSVRLAKPFPQAYR
jgi:hypothetical protein